MQLDVRIVDPDGNELFRWENPEPRVIVSGRWYFDLSASFQGLAAGHQLVWREQVIATAEITSGGWVMVSGPTTFHLDYQITPKRSAPTAVSGGLV
jgi:hypothetical protein